jgi:hypothetical protein
MSHKGKATSGVSYNPKDPPEAYTNPSVHTRISEYTSAARSVHGPEYDFDAEITMRVGGGKKHSGTGLATASSTRPLLPLSPIFEHGARAQARPYGHGRALHSTESTHSRLFQFYSSYIDLYTL